MKIIYVNTPIQDENTENPQIIDGKIPHWVVKTEALKLGETLGEFFQRKWDGIHDRGLGENLEGFYLYDAIPVGQIVGNPKEGAMMVRYEYIKKDDS